MASFVGKLFSRQYRAYVLVAGLFMVIGLGWVAPMLPLIKWMEGGKKA